MTELFKHKINKEVVLFMAEHFKKHHDLFNAEGFVLEACSGLESLELKTRSHHITEAMIKYFPADYSQACSLILASFKSNLIKC